MRLKSIISIAILGLLLAGSSCCSPEKAANRNPAQQQKCLTKTEEKDRKKSEKADRKAKKMHDKIQSKETRKMMKQTKKLSKQYNTGKKGFFLFRWFRKD